MASLVVVGEAVCDKDCILQIQNVQDYFVISTNMIGQMTLIMIVNQCKVTCYADITRQCCISSSYSAVDLQ